MLFSQFSLIVPATRWTLRPTCFTPRLPGQTSLANHPFSLSGSRLIVSFAFLLVCPALANDPATAATALTTDKGEPTVLAANESGGGIVLTMSMPWAYTAQDLIRELRAMTERGTVTQAQARVLFQRMQVASPGDNVWRLLGEAKLANRDQWSQARAAEHQLAALLRDGLLTARVQALGSGGLGSLIAMQDIGAWPDSPPANLDFDSRFETAWFAVNRSDVDPATTNKVINRIDRLMREQFGAGTGQLGITMTGYAYDPVTDAFTSADGVAWTPRPETSVQSAGPRLIDPGSGKVTATVPGQSDALAARLIQVSLAKRLPAMFDNQGRLRAGLQTKDIEQILRARSGLSEITPPYVSTTTGNAADRRPVDAALTAIDAAMRVASLTPPPNQAQAIPTLARLLAVAAQAVDADRDKTPWQDRLSAVEIDLLRHSRELDAAPLARTLAETEIARFIEVHPEPAAWTTAESPVLALAISTFMPVNTALSLFDLLTTVTPSTVTTASMARCERENPATRSCKAVG